MLETRKLPEEENCSTDAVRSNSDGRGIRHGRIGATGEARQRSKARGQANASDRERIGKGTISSNLRRRRHKLIRRIDRERYRNVHRIVLNGDVVERVNN